MRRTGCGREGCHHPYELHEHDPESGTLPCFGITMDGDLCDCADWVEP